MSKQSREEYYKEIAKRYRNSDKDTKSKILNEFCEVCGYNRKYACLFRSETQTGDS